MWADPCRNPICRGTTRSAKKEAFVKFLLATDRPRGTPLSSPKLSVLLEKNPLVASPGKSSRLFPLATHPAPSKSSRIRRDSLSLLHVKARHRSVACRPRLGTRPSSPITRTICLIHTAITAASSRVASKCGFSLECTRTYHGEPTSSSESAIPTPSLTTGSHLAPWETALQSSVVRNSPPCKLSCYPPHGQTDPGREVPLSCLISCLTRLGSLLTAGVQSRLPRRKDDERFSHASSKPSSKLEPRLKDRHKLETRSRARKPRLSLTCRSHPCECTPSLPPTLAGTQNRSSLAHYP